MNKNKILSILLIAALTFTSTTSTFAKDTINNQPLITPTPILNSTTLPSITDAQAEKSVKISKEKAKEIAKGIMKTYFNTIIDESKFTQRSNLNTNYNGTQDSSWSINWDMSNMEKNINISVILNAETGEVIQASNYERMGNEENKVPTITVKEAEKISDDFLKKIQPKKFLESNKRNNNNLGYYGTANYNFNYISKVNGIEFDGNNIAIEIDGVKGKVVSYNSNWNSNLKFPEIKGIVDAKAAVEAFKNEAKMTLRYTSFMQNYSYYENKRDVKLLYVPEFSNGNMLNAIDGKFMDPNNNVNSTLTKDLNQKEKEEFYNSAKVGVPREKAIEEEEAGKIIKGFISKIYGEGYVIQNLGYQEDVGIKESGVNKNWNASFSKGELGKYSENGYVSIDALTGEILNFNKYSNEEYNLAVKFEAKLTWEQAYAKAIEAVATYYPGMVKQIKTQQIHLSYNDYDKMGERNYYFNFSRLENGVEYNENSINVGFSAVTGVINNLNCNWDKTIKFPEITKTISKEDASKILSDKYKPVLVYTQINKSVNLGKPDYEIKLAYKLSDTNGMYEYTNIDAFTGKFLNYNGENIDPNIELFKEKIKNSKAEKELSILAAKGLIETVDFKLDKKITQIDLIKILVTGRGYTPYMAEKTSELNFSNITKADANYKYLQMAVSYGIMENSEGKFIEDQLVTREELAKVLVKFTNYSKLAQHSELFNLKYKDVSKISKGNLGYVAIAEAFGFIKIQNNEFKPKDNTTMEQLAIGVYNALNNVRSTQ